MSLRKLIRRISKDIGLSDSRVEISSPTNFEHRVHVFLDDTGRYIGLPQQWADLIGNKARRKARRTESSPDLLLAARRRSSALRRAEITTGGKQDAGMHGGHNGYLAGSLENPRSRSSVADHQDLIIERLKLELKDYKMNHPSEFNSMLENSYSVDRPLALSRETQNEGIRHTLYRTNNLVATKKAESAV